MKSRFYDKTTRTAHANKTSRNTVPGTSCRKEKRTAHKGSGSSLVAQQGAVAVASAVPTSIRPNRDADSAPGNHAVAQAAAPDGTRSGQAGGDAGSPTVSLPLPAPPFTERAVDGISITDSGLALIELLSANGHTQIMIARALGITSRTLMRIRKRDARVQDAYDHGLGLNQVELVSILMSRARSGGKDAAISAMFLLKTKHAFREGELPRDSGRATNVTINLPGALSPEQYMQRLQIDVNKIAEKENA